MRVSRRQFGEILRGPSPARDAFDIGAKELDPVHRRDDRVSIGIGGGTVQRQVQPRSGGRGAVFHLHPQGVSSGRLGGSGKQGCRQAEW